MHSISSFSMVPQTSSQSWLASIDDKTDLRGMRVVDTGSWEPEVIAARSFKTGLGVGAGI